MQFWKQESLKTFKKKQIPQLIMKSPLIMKTFWCCTVNSSFVGPSGRHLTPEIPLSRDLSVSGRISNICAREAKNQHQRDWRGRNGRFANVKERGGCPPEWTWLQSRYTLLSSPYTRCWTSGLRFSKDKMQMQ